MTMKSKTIKFWAIVMGISGVITLALATNYFMNREFLMGPISSLAGISNIGLSAVLTNLSKKQKEENYENS